MKRGVQIFKCNDCKRQFTGGNRINNESLWKEYTFGKQTYKQLSIKYGISIRTIQRRLDKILINNSYYSPKECNVLMDTTYFGRNFGVMVFANSEGKHLYWKYVNYETVLEYVEGINYLKSKGIRINSIVIDGRKGLFKAFKEYPVQMCHFHQVAIITRYITRKPKAQASKELKELMSLLPITDKDSFFKSIDQWYKKWKGFVNERFINPETNQSRFAHKRLRSAYKSIERNKAYLFTYKDFTELGIPNTTNQLEGTFTDLKNKLRNHNGLNRKRKIKLINDYFSDKQ